MKVKRKKGFFSISAVAKMFSIHQQTIRLYEKQGLIAPTRSAGNTRLFSEEDIDRLEEVIYLTHEMGINLAGVEMILKLKKQIRKLQKEVNIAFDETAKNLDEHIDESKSVIERNRQKLITLKNKETFVSIASPKVIDSDQEKEYWEVEYED